MQLGGNDPVEVFIELFVCHGFLSKSCARRFRWSARRPARACCRASSAARICAWNAKLYRFSLELAEREADHASIQDPSKTVLDFAPYGRFSGQWCSAADHPRGRIWG